VNVHGAALSGNSTTNISRTLAQLAGVEHLDTGVFWLTLTDGQVTGIAEQYLP
jgi:cytidylate kinase